MADAQIAAGAPATLSATFTDQHGEPAPPSGTVTVTVTRDDGTAVLTAAATTTPTNDANTRTVDLTAAQTASLDLLTAVWTAAGDSRTLTTTVEVVGGFYVSEADVRGMPNVTDSAKFSADKVRAARSWFESTFEHYTGKAWVPRYTRETLDGTSTDRLLLTWPAVRSIRSVATVDTTGVSTAFTADELAGLVVEPWGLVVRRSGTWFTRGSGNVVLRYEHGEDRPPDDVHQAALLGIRDYLLSDRAGDRVLSLQTPDGIVRSSYAGPDRPFGIPFVDEVANRRRVRAPPVA